MHHKDKLDANTLKTIFLTAIFLGSAMAGASAQAGFPDSLRRVSDSGAVPFRLGTAVTLAGGPSLYPPNGYQPGLLTDSPPDRAYQALVGTQFNEIEPGNEFKMMSLWTGGVARVHGHYVAQTNLYDKNGPLMQVCDWAGRQTPRLTVRGHCMVYYPSYTLPTFPAPQPALFVKNDAGRWTLNSPYTPADLREMLRSYVEQVVEATLWQNARSRARGGGKIITAWDVTNEVVSDEADEKTGEKSTLGFAYRDDDPWHSSGPHDAKNADGYDYAPDIYRWASEKMDASVGKKIRGEKITAADKFALYYNDYNLEWNASKMTRVLRLIQRIRQNHARVDGLGFQAHVEARGLDVNQFETNIQAALQNHLRFSVTENDCAIKDGKNQPSLDQQTANQGSEYGAVVTLCVKYKTSCDTYQIWGATDDGSWLQNQSATPITRWVADTRDGPTRGQMGYWPKVGQLVSATTFDVGAKAVNPNSGRAVSDAYTQILAALQTSQKQSK